MADENQEVSKLSHAERGKKGQEALKAKKAGGSNTGGGANLPASVQQQQQPQYLGTAAGGSGITWETYIQQAQQVQQRHFTACAREMAALHAQLFASAFGAGETGLNTPT